MGENGEQSSTPMESGGPVRGMKEKWVQFQALDHCPTISCGQCVFDAYLLRFRPHKSAAYLNDPRVEENVLLRFILKKFFSQMP